MMDSTVLILAYGVCCTLAGFAVGILLGWNRADRTVDLVARTVFRGQSERAWKRCDKLEAQLESYNLYNGEDQLVGGPRWWTNRMDKLKIEIEVLEARIERLGVGKKE